MEPQSFTGYILTALALVFVIEGLLWAVFPEQMRRMMAMAILMPSAHLRRFGIIAVGIGFALVFLFGKFSS